MRRARPLTRNLGWFLIAMVLLVAPTRAGRGLLLLWVEGACPPDCACEGDEGAEQGHTDGADSASHARLLEDASHFEHDCAIEADSDDCPPDCTDCSCCAAPTVAAQDFLIPTSVALQSYDLELRGPPSTERRTARHGPYRPPKSHRPRLVAHG